MVNEREIRERTSKFWDAYFQVVEDLEAHSDDKERVVTGASIDGEYALIAGFNRGFFAICRESDYEIIFMYYEDDETDWTVGDLLGGYLDLYFTR